MSLLAPECTTLNVPISVLDKPEKVILPLLAPLNPDCRNNVLPTFAIVEL